MAGTYGGKGSGRSLVRREGRSRRSIASQHSIQVSLLRIGTFRFLASELDIAVGSSSSRVGWLQQAVGLTGTTPLDHETFRSSRLALITLPFLSFFSIWGDHKLSRKKIVQKPPHSWVRCIVEPYNASRQPVHQFWQKWVMVVTFMCAWPRPSRSARA